MLLHLDADAFFASCEQALNPAYQGKPVVTGLERNIVSSASYEAKALGIKRGIPLWQVRKICPQVILLPSNYETYGLFSVRMFEIMRRITPLVEEYSIDEAFADLTGLRGPLHKSYLQMAKLIQGNIQQELGISVSIGLAKTKVLAKLGSRWHKPHGLVSINAQNRAAFLKNTIVEDIWGIARQTGSYLRKYQIKNAWEFAELPEIWVNKKLAKPYREIWQELNEHCVNPVNPQPKAIYKNISKTKTFTPPSQDRNYLFSQLSKNLENALIKARRYQLATRKIAIFLKTQNFRYYGLEAKLSRPTCFPPDILPLAEKLFAQIFKANILYRATGIVLLDLQTASQIQLNLFEAPLKIEKLIRVYSALDALDKKFGKHTLYLGSSHAVIRENTLERKFIGLPVLGQVN